MDAARALPEAQDSRATDARIDPVDDDVQSRIVAAQESERRRLAQEVHDGPAQALSNAIFHVEYIERVAQGDPAAIADELRQLREVLRRGLDDVRAFISQLRPPVLDELGLDGALREATERAGLASGATIRTHLDGSDATLSDAQRIVALRIAQEALQNVRKHAAASVVTVRTRSTDDSWSLEVMDDGRGFDMGPEAARDRNSFGIRFMHERAELIGARLDVRSRPGDGTVVHLAIPTVALTGA